jgi:hypothetical protein
MLQMAISIARLLMKTLLLAETLAIALSLSLSPRNPSASQSEPQCISMQKYDLQKNTPLKQTKNPSRYYYNSSSNFCVQIGLN